MNIKLLFISYALVFFLDVGVINLKAQNISILDTIYTPSNYEDGPLTATIYMPDVSNGVGVVVAHFFNGTRETPAVWCDTLAARGYVVMSIDYYDWDTPTYGVYPKPIRAFKTAVEFLRRNADNFGITTGKIAGLGQSEGAVHWGQTIIWDNDDEYFHTDPAIDDHLNAVILFYGHYDMNNYLQSVFPVDDLFAGFFSPDSSLRFSKGNCIANVANITTPVLLFHGSSDPVARYEQSVSLNDSLIAYGKSSELHINDSWDHVFDIAWQSPPYSFTSQGLIVKDTVLKYLERTVLVTSVFGENSVSAYSALLQNYPNPFNPETIIKYQLDRETWVSLKVYDILGKEAAVLVNEDQNAGLHQVKFKASDLPSGVYFYTLNAEDFSKTLKLLLMK